MCPPLRTDTSNSVFEENRGNKENAINGSISGADNDMANAPRTGPGGGRWHPAVQVGPNGGHLYTHSFYLMIMLVMARVPKFSNDTVCNCGEDRPNQTSNFAAAKLYRPVMAPRPPIHPNPGGATLSYGHFFACGWCCSCSCVCTVNLTMNWVPWREILSCLIYQPNLNLNIITHLSILYNILFTIKKSSY